MEVSISPFRSAAFFALIAATVTLVVVKFVTGLAFAPLAALAVLVFAFALGLKLRIDRASRRSR